MTNKREAKAYEKARAAYVKAAKASRAQKYAQADGEAQADESASSPTSGPPEEQGVEVTLDGEDSGAASTLASEERFEEGSGQTSASGEQTSPTQSD